MPPEGEAAESLPDTVRRLEEEVRTLREEVERREAALPPIPAPTPTAGGSVADLWSWIQGHLRLGLTLNTFFLLQHHTAASSGLPPDHSTWTVGQVEVDLWSELDHGVDFRFDLDFTEDDAGTSIALPDEFSLEQGYVQADLGRRILPGIPVRVAFGRWNGPLGFEGVDAPVLWQFSRSNVATYLTPQNLVGIRGTVHTDLVDVDVWASNGWEALGSDPNFDVDAEKTFGTRVDVRLVPQAMDGGRSVPLIEIRPSLLVGHAETNLLSVFPATGRNPQAGDLRTTFDLVILANYRDRYRLGLEVSLGHESNIDDAGGSDQGWEGILVSANVWPLAWLGLTLRGDYIRDQEGTMTGVPQYLKSFTTALLWKIPTGTRLIDEVHVNVEWRYDRSQTEIFSRSGAGSLDRTWRSQLAVQVFFAF